MEDNMSERKKLYRKIKNTISLSFLMILFILKNFEFNEIQIEQKEFIFYF